MKDSMLVHSECAPTREEVMKAREEDDVDVKKTEPRKRKGYSVA
jgi:hypothetical protein